MYFKLGNSSISGGREPLKLLLDKDLFQIKIY